ncbi:MAG: PP2C family protein-serine/threonine phosphatase [Gammaproteobacteria bacterium]
MRFEMAEVSLLGDREENQDRFAAERHNGNVLLVVADGMGGHSGGALAAETAVDSLQQSFAEVGRDVDCREFLRLAIEQAHDAVVAIGAKIGIGSRPRATCAACMVQDGRAVWAHVGDSRIYLLRDGQITTRTRDHTPIESLLQDGLISEEEIAGHPMRHYVEYCLGGLAERPLITVSETVPLAAGDLLLVCSDGLWSSLAEADLAAGPGADMTLEDWLARIAGRAVRAATPNADNTTAVALRVQAD